MGTQTGPMKGPVVTQGGKRPQVEPTLPTQASSLQNCGNKFLLFKLPVYGTLLWYLVIYFVPSMSCPLSHISCSAPAGADSGQQGRFCALGWNWRL